MQVEEIIGAVETWLSRQRGHRVTLEAQQTRRGNAGAFRIAGTSDAVFVKRPPARGATAYDPDATDPFAPVGRLRNEARALTILRETGRVPAIRHVDPARGFLVLDVVDGAPLDGILRGTDPRHCTEALVGLSTTLGDVHAYAVDRIDAFEADARAQHGPRPDDGLDRVRAGWGDLTRAADQADVRVGPAVEAAVATLFTELSAPGPFQTLRHADPCPDNALWTPDGVVLLDFELARPGHALLDGAFLRMAWPTCWCAHTCPVAVVARAEAAYRRALATAIPEAEDDRCWTRALAAACLAHVCFTAAIHLDSAWDADSTWGVATLRARVCTRLALAQAPLRRAGHGSVADLFAELRSVLSARWDDDALVDMPAFDA